MAYGADNSQATVDMYTIGRPVGGSDGTYIRTLYVAPDGTLAVNDGGRVTTPIAAATAANTVVSAVPGKLASVLVTTAGTANMLIYDNATTNSGTIIGVIPSGATVGQVYTLNMPAANGITVAGSASNAGVTISWSA